MKILILIPTKDTVDPKCLEAVHSQDYKNYSVLVNRKEGNGSRIKSIIENRQELRKRALASDADYFLWLDSDVVLPKDALSRFMANPRPLLGGQYPMGNRWSVGSFENGVLMPLKMPTGIDLKVDHLSFGCIMMSREVLEKIDIRESCGQRFRAEGGIEAEQCECLSFCEDAKKAGYQPIAIPVICGHNKDYLGSVSLIELKAAWLDTIMMIEQQQKNLQNIQQEVQKRQQINNQPKG